METTHDWKRMSFTLEGTRRGTECREKIQTFRRIDKFGQNMSIPA